VRAAADRVKAAGGEFRGKITRFVGPSGNLAEFVFMTDPEGNIIDLFTRVD
jgi:predicted enzyme related to lactoylglutathione lyase